MKNTLCLILTLLFMTLTFTPSSITQTPQDDPQQGDFPDGEKTRIGKGKHRINDIKFSPDGTRLAVAGDFGILLYDVQMSGKNVQKGNIPVKFIGHLGRACSVAFSQDGIMISSASSGKTIRIRLWDVDTGQLLRTFTEHTTLSAWCIAFSPDGKTIAIKDLEKNIYLLDADTGKHLRTLTGHTSLIWWIVFSPDSRTIATASYDKTIRLWDVNTGQLLRTPIGHTEQIKSVSFSPDGRTIATGSHDKTIRLWDVNTGKLLRTFKNRRRIFSVAFSPDGRMVTGSHLSGIRLWDVNTGKLLRIFRKWGSGVGTSLAVFSPDGRTIAACGHNEVDLWDPNTGQLLRRLKIPD